jgi:hypothetical protein
MEKLENMQKQLLFLHAEFRKVKAFHKDSSQIFKKFNSDMTSSLKSLNKGNIFNEIHYLNMLNLNTIEFFTSQVLRQSNVHSMIHLRLKEEGNKLKVFEKELTKRIKSIKTAIMKQEGSNLNIGESTFAVPSGLRKEESQILNFNLEIETTLKELSAQFTLIRQTIQKSFDDYIETLCSFAETKTRLKFLHGKSEENFKECSPLMEKKFDLLMNLNDSRNDYLKIQSRNLNYNSRVVIPLRQVENYQDERVGDVQESQNNEYAEQVQEEKYFKENYLYSKSENKKSDETNDYSSNSFFTPLKGRKFQQVINSDYRLPSHKSPLRNEKSFIDQRSQMVDSYLKNKRKSLNQSVCNEEREY